MPKYYTEGKIVNIDDLSFVVKNCQYNQKMKMCNNWLLTRMYILISKKKIFYQLIVNLDDFFRVIFTYNFE